MYALIIALTLLPQTPIEAKRIELEVECTCPHCRFHHPLPPGKVIPAPAEPKCGGTGCLCGKACHPPRTCHYSQGQCRQFNPALSPPACGGQYCKCGATCQPRVTCHNAYGICHGFAWPPVVPLPAAPILTPVVPMPAAPVCVQGSYRVRVRHRFRLFGRLFGGGCCR